MKYISIWWNTVKFIESQWNSMQLDRIKLPIKSLSRPAVNSVLCPSLFLTLYWRVMRTCRSAPTPPGRANVIFDTCSQSCAPSKPFSDTLLHRKRPYRTCTSTHMKVQRHFLSDASFPNWFQWVGDPVWNYSRSIYWGLKYLYKTCYRSSGPPSCCTGCTLQVSLQNSLKRRCHQKLNPAQLLSWFLLNMLHWRSWQLTGRCSRRRICRRSISKFSQVLR